MVKRETYYAFNLYGPRLDDPPRAPPGLTDWNGYPLLPLIQALPFDRSDLATLSDESDIVKFGQVFDFRIDGDLRAEFLAFIDEFCVEKPSPASDEPRSDIRRDPDFITAAKYPFALRQMLRGLIGEDFAFCFELPYLVEAENDLLMSFELATQGYAKQSIQILRNVIEVTVAHAYFGVRGDDYYYLADNPDFRMPSLGGPKGMIHSLIEAHVMPERLAADCRGLYALMSKATHSRIAHLNPTLSESGIPVDWADLAPRVGAVLIELVLRLVMKGI
ncbi:MAG: hypothetical protein ACRCVA_23130 [Phreatobacter sp.]